jgi:putative oxidoreductase
MDKSSACDFGLLWLRVSAGAGIAYHGYGKIFGGKMAEFVQGVGSMGFPAPEVFAWAAVLSEFIGGICVALGLFTRPAALLIFVTMSVAVFIRHGADPLKKKELALAYWTIAGALIFLGAGKFSFDRWLKPGREKTSKRR